MKLNELLASHARKGAELGPTIGGMCDSCAFRLNSPANLEEDTVDMAAGAIMSGLQVFHCHRRDAEGKLVDAGHQCAGYRYALRYAEWMEQDQKENS